MIDWGLTALSAQIGYIVPSKSMLQLKKNTETNKKGETSIREKSKKQNSLATIRYTAPTSIISV